MARNMQLKYRKSRILLLCDVNRDHSIKKLLNEVEQDIYESASSDTVTQTEALIITHTLQERNSIIVLLFTLLYITSFWHKPHELAKRHSV